MSNSLHLVGSFIGQPNRVLIYSSPEPWLSIEGPVEIPLDVAGIDRIELEFLLHHGLSGYWNGSWDAISHEPEQSVVEIEFEAGDGVMRSRRPVGREGIVKVLFYSESDRIKHDLGDLVELDAGLELVSVAIEVAP